MNICFFQFKIKRWWCIVILKRNVFCTQYSSINWIIVCYYINRIKSYQKSESSSSSSSSRERHTIYSRKCPQTNLRFIWFMGFRKIKNKPFLSLTWSLKIWMLNTKIWSWKQFWRRAQNCLSHSIDCGKKTEAIIFFDQLGSF